MNGLTLNTIHFGINILAMQGFIFQIKTNEILFY